MICIWNIGVVHNGWYTCSNRFIDDLSDGGICSIDEQTCWLSTDHFFNGVYLSWYIPICRTKNRYFHLHLFAPTFECSLVVVNVHRHCHSRSYHDVFFVLNMDSSLGG